MRSQRKLKEIASVESAASAEAEKTGNGAGGKDSGEAGGTLAPAGVTTAKEAEPSAVEKSKKAEGLTLPKAAPSAEAEKTGNGAGGKDSGEAGGTLAPAGVTTAKEAEPSAVEKSKKAEGLTLPKAAPSAEAEKTGNGAGGKDSGEAGGTLAPAGVTTAKEAEPSAGEKSKKAEGLTLPKAAPSAEAEKTGNGGGKDSGEAAATPAAGGVTTAKSAEPSAKQGAGALDESIPKGAEASVSDGFEQQGLATSPRKWGWRQ